MRKTDRTTRNELRDQIAKEHAEAERVRNEIRAMLNGGTEVLTGIVFGDAGAFGLDTAIRLGYTLVLRRDPAREGKWRAIAVKPELYPA